MSLISSSAVFFEEVFALPVFADEVFFALSVFFAEDVFFAVSVFFAAAVFAVSFTRPAASRRAFCVSPRGFAICFMTASAGIFSFFSIFPTSEAERPLTASASAACESFFAARASFTMVPNFFAIRFLLLKYNRTIRFT